MSQSIHDFGFLGQGHYAHGTRQNYVTGCRCIACKAANACYEQQRATARANGTAAWVSAEKAKAKLEMLSRLRIGHRRAAYLAGVSVRTIQRIRTGQVQRICPRVEQAILGITKLSLAKGVYVNGYQTRHYVESLLREDYPEAWVAQRLGFKHGRLHWTRVVRVGRALKARILYQTLLAEQ